MRWDTHVVPPSVVPRMAAPIPVPATSQTCAVEQATAVAKPPAKAEGVLTVHVAPPSVVT
jgi:hypothetical protein